MTTDSICLKEEDIIRLIQAYFDFRGLHLSLDAIERETGVINCQYPEEALVLRHLIVDGRWTDALNYIGRLPLKEQDLKFMTFEIMKQKYVELICVYEELGNELYEDLGHAIALCFSELSTYCPCPVEYENLRKLASLTKLSQDAQYEDWNPISSRRKCFQTVCSVLMEMPGLEDEFTDQLMDSDRLPDLLVKGILYESCEEYCEAKASTQTETTKFRFGNLKRSKDSKSSDLNLYSWLQSVPWVKMTHLFKCRSLTVNVDKLNHPALKASWTEKILQNSTDLPEDVARELRRPSSSSEDLKEHFWNRKIQRNLIVDAPEILRRAEEVITRWEKRNLSSGKRESDKSSSKDARYGSVKGGCAGDSKEVSGKLANTRTSYSQQKKSEGIISASESCSRSKASQEKIDCSLSSTTEDTETKTVAEFFVPNNYEGECDAVVGNAHEHNAKFDEKQNIRDLLKAKEAVRDKLLQILKNSTNGQNNKAMAVETEESSENLEEPICNKILNKQENSSEIKDLQQPFYMQLQLLRDKGSHLETIFKPKPEKVTDNLSSPADMRKMRKQCSTDILSTGSRPELPVRQQNSPTEFQSRKEKCLTNASQGPGSGESSEAKHNFVAVTQLEDEQAIRSVEFHPSGKFYAVGSNTKALRICAYPNCKEIRPDQEPREPTILYKKQKHHKGSIYCMAWNATGDLLATGSNDKTVKLMRFNSNTCQLEDIAHPLTMHGGTVRDMCFMEDLSNRSNLLISGGSGDNKIYITDCETAMPFQSLTGHTGQILSLYTWGGVMFVSSSQDKTIRFWDMRTRGCVHQISSRPVGGTGPPGSAAAAISVDPSGRLLVAGHEDSTCMLYDMKGNRILQTFKPHTADIRTCRLSPKAFYLLTGSYDCKLMLTDLQGDLTQQLATVRVAEHADKVIQGRWHPKEFTFISTSADKTATLWSLPQT